jgi:hypothetical protein
MRAFVCAILLTLGAGEASAVVLDFNATSSGDPLAAGDPFTQFVVKPGTATSSATVGRVSVIPNRSGGATEAVIFDTDNPTGNDGPLGNSDLASPFSGVDGPREFGNILIIPGPDNGLGTPDDDNRGGTIRFDFNRKVNFYGLTLLDNEEGVDILADGLLIAANLIAGNNSYLDVVFTNEALGVRQIDVVFAGSGGLDNFNVVPIPLTLPLLASGLAALGFVGRRRRAPASA